MRKGTKATVAGSITALLLVALAIPALAGTTAPSFTHTIKVTGSAANGYTIASTVTVTGVDRARVQWEFFRAVGSNDYQITSRKNPSVTSSVHVACPEGGGDRKPAVQVHTWSWKVVGPGNDQQTLTIAC